MEYAVPIMPSRNLRETLEFYERLGFEMRGAGPEEYGYIILGLGAMIELHFWETPEVDPLTTDHSCYIRVVDADALHAEWEGVGIEPDPETGSRLMTPCDTDSRLMTPCDTDYGMREFALVDGSGNLLRIGSPIEA